jgi:type I restriction enzyme S subunit
LSFDACFPDSDVGFDPNASTNNVFIYYWFAFFQQLLEKQAPESAQKNINLKILNDLNVIVPSIENRKDLRSLFITLTN